jgi:hypothetical protein
MLGYNTQTNITVGTGIYEVPFRKIEHEFFTKMNRIPTLMEFQILMFFRHEQGAFYSGRQFTNINNGPVAQQGDLTRDDNTSYS